MSPAITHSSLFFYSLVPQPPPPSVIMTAPVIQCLLCSEIFPSKGYKDSHNKDKCPNKVFKLVISESQTVDIKLSAEKDFQCLCQEGKCLKNFSSFRPFARHVQQCSKPWGVQVSNLGDSNSSQICTNKAYYFHQDVIVVDQPQTQNETENPQNGVSIVF